ncbi:MAG: DUF4393 domain-containing protein [Oscillospiraceae bacterium]|nr:DUF4393 domain-containing protein [Oscillospiraceae bacterium]
MDGNEIATAAATEGIKVVGEVVSNIYLDVFQPAAQEIGKYLGEWVAAKFDHLREKVEKKMDEIPPERRVNVQLEDVLPILEAYKNIKYEDTELQDMFVNLLTSYADSEAKSISHRAFAKIIEELGPYDALILRKIYRAVALEEKEVFVIDNHILGIGAVRMVRGMDLERDLDELKKIERSLDNFERLNLLRIEKAIEEYVGNRLREYDKKIAISCVKSPQYKVSITRLGLDFCRTCIK